MQIINKDGNKYYIRLTFVVNASDNQEAYEKAEKVEKILKRENIRVLI